MGKAGDMAHQGWNILIYANDNGDPASVEIRAAIDELRHVSMPADCRFAVQLNTANSTKRYWSDASHDQSAAVDAETSEALTRFLDQATNKLGTRKTMLAMCAHGDALDELSALIRKLRGRGMETYNHERAGVSGGFKSLLIPYRWGPAPKSHKYLSNPDIAKAIANSVLEQVDVLGFNACAMGMLEVAYEMRNVSDVFVASQVPAHVWSYRNIVARLQGSQSAEQLAAVIVDSARGEFLSNQRQDAIGAFRSGASLRDLTAKLDYFAAKLLALTAEQFSVVSNAALTALRGVDDPQQADLLLLAVTLASGIGDHHIADASNDLVNALVNARIDHAAHPAHPGVSGLSVFCPTQNIVSIEKAYAGLAFQPQAWIALLERLQRTTSIPQVIG